MDSYVVFQGVEREVGSSRVRLSLADANDNSPTFESGLFRLRVREDAPAGSLIAPLAASDRDSGIFGTLTYSLKGFGAERFRTDSVHGGIYVSNYSRGEWSISAFFNLWSRDHFNFFFYGPHNNADGIFYFLVSCLGISWY